jgi:hypothetical protein
VDVYLPGPGGEQIHDFNPSTFPPVGLFWTIELPDDSVEVRLGKGSATLKASDVPVFDYGTLGNALFGPVPSPLPTGSVTFTVVWSGVQQRVNIRNTDPVYGGFAGEFIRNHAQMEWTATVGDYTFVSDPLTTSSSVFAENRPRAERFVLPGGVAGGRPATLLVAGRAFSSGCSTPSSKLRRLEGTASWLSASDQRAPPFGHPGGRAGTSLVH